ncbi:Clas95 [Clostera anastomosis granulovirus B]|uniref:Clas95 n=1 Tax=Clostera anastomosis granulovirus B TaxID=1986290 RepID=A0A0K0WSN7_9BBAC|nr:Clas95 [Clostera anastomosis granulovirus B]AKS25438.1 Clas95 [Clostera anastomosis granulovirus B]
MNFDFLKDLINLNPIKTSYISNMFRNNFNFILNDHVMEKQFNTNEVTLLEKLSQIFILFNEQRLNRDLVYKLLGNKLDLTQVQFYYLYDKIKQDVYINNLLYKLCSIINTNFDAPPETLKIQLLNVIDDEDGFTNISSFLIRECNNAVKIIQ